MLDRRVKLRVAHVVEPDRGEERRQVALAHAGERRLVPRARIKHNGGLPERRDRRPSPGQIPHRGRDHPAGPGYPRHLAQAGDRIRHEVDHELRQRRVEPGVGEGQIFGGAAPDVDAGVALAHRRDEELRRVDGSDRAGAEPGDELGREHARAAADVNHALAGGDARKVVRAAARAWPSSGP